MKLAARDVRQLYSSEKVHRGKNGVSHTYTVHAAMADGRRETVLSGLTDSEQALYIEQRLEQFLGISDTPMPGELPR